MLYKNLGVSPEGHLTIGGADAVALAGEFGTPLYLLDEDMIGENAALYVDALKKYAPGGSLPFYASKALSFKRLYRVIEKTGMGCDLVSPGEIHTALAAGFDMQKTIFHGNNKTDADIAYAMDAGVGFFAVDTFEELDALNAIAAKKGKRQDILLRLTPGVDAHTHKAVQTGNVDSKFGFPLFSGDAAKAVRRAVSMENLRPRGLLCHIGSQIFEIESFLHAAGIMLDFAKKENAPLEILNMGGGLGVPYDKGDMSVNIEKSVETLCTFIKEKCAALGLAMPNIFLEPGRSIVASAGTTLYTVGSVKEIPGVRNYVSIDGGMADNPRYALYQSVYTVVLANRMKEKADFTCTVAGRCCESGDLIQENVDLPRPRRGDILAVLGTGAYNFSMASNYNRLLRPALVTLSGACQIWR